MNLFTRYLNSAAVFSPPDDDRSDIQKQRDSIVVDVGEVVEPEAEDDAVETEKDTEEEAESESEEEEGEEEEVEAKEDSDEDKAAKAAKEKEDRKQARIQKRIDKAVSEAKSAKAEADELRKQLAEKPVDGLSEEEVERRAEEKAARKLQELQMTDTKKQFEKDCDKLREQAVTIDKDFDNKIAVAAEELGAIPSRMIGILADLDNENGGKVLNYLADNIDEAEEIWNLSEGRMTAKLIRISDKIKAAEKPAPKPKSKVPPPVSDVNEGNRPAKKALPDKPLSDLDSWIKIRNKEAEEYRKQKNGY